MWNFPGISVYLLYYSEKTGKVQAISPCFAKCQQISRRGKRVERGGADVDDVKRTGGPRRGGKGRKRRRAEKFKKTEGFPRGFPQCGNIFRTVNMGRGAARLTFPPRSGIMEP